MLFARSRLLCCWRRFAAIPIFHLSSSAPTLSQTDCEDLGRRGRPADGFVDVIKKGGLKPSFPEKT